ncbi:MAG: methyltransferase [Myxococcota bacterium]
MADWLRGHPLRGRVLVVDDDPLAPENALLDAGAEVDLWRRRASPRGAATPWPPEGPFDAAVARLPAAREALEMTLHAVGARLEAGGLLYLYGANPEGIRSAGRRLERVLGGAAESVETRRHCRIWAVRRGVEARPLRSRLRDWRVAVTLELEEGDASGVERLVSYPGVFSHGRLDPGSRMLIEALAQVAPGARALDFGCGIGVLARALRRRWPELALDLVDSDALAVAAAAENLPGARVVCGSGLATLPAGSRYGLIVSNPPLHRGVARDASVLLELCAEAPSRLAPGGSLVLVTRRVQPLGEILGDAFASVEVLRQDSRYRVWRAST